MEKKKYIPWEMEILELAPKDIITTSYKYPDDETQLIHP